MTDSSPVGRPLMGDAIARPTPVSITVTDTIPASASVVAVPVSADGALPDAINLSRERLEAAGFDAKAGSVLALPGSEGPPMVAVGIGAPGALDVDDLRDAAAAFARSVGSHTDLTFVLDGIDLDGTDLDSEAAAQAVLEGVVLARYRFDALRHDPGLAPVAAITLVGGTGDIAGGAHRGERLASATWIARDLANSPHSHMSATHIADLAASLGPEHGLEVEVYDKDVLIEMGCGGLLGVNAGSAEPPRMITMSYSPAAGAGRGHLALVGKGLMYDSGGLSLKPGDEVHAQMKNDMSGAAAVFGAMLQLSALDCPTAVTAYLMCTDNMPSGTAMALGDVLTIRGGTTVEVINTDAEGRLVMADALVLAAEQGVDAIIDMATLTGACMRALGTKVAGVMGNNDALISQVQEAAEQTAEPVWQLPLESRYRHELDSNVADLRNLGGANAGAITAALFLAEFVDDVPWAHIDIAGTAQSTGDAGWQTAGCTGFGARLLVQLALDFVVPAR